MDTDTTNQSPAVQMVAFETEIKSAVLDLRQNLGEALGGTLPPGFKAVELHRTFGVDRRLGWMITRLVKDDDIFEASRHFPGKAGFRRFLRAARAHDLDADLLATAERAGDRIAEIMETHTGDRDTFDMLLAGLADSSRDEEELAQRKAAFSASSFVYGVQAQVQVAMFILTPSADGEQVDLAAVSGFLSLRRLRHNRSWPLMVRRATRGQTAPHAATHFEPIDDTGLSGPDDVPLLHRFCSPRQPEVTLHPIGDRVDEFRLAPAPVGNIGTMTCLMGEIAHNAGPLYRTPEDTTAGLSATVTTPISSLMLDHYVHPDLVGYDAPRLDCFNDVHRFTRGRGSRAEHDRLTPLCQVQDLGTGRAASRVANIDWYSDMVGHVFDRIGQDITDYRCFRANVPYPPMGSTAVFTHDLPERGA